MTLPEVEEGEFPVKLTSGIVVRPGSALLTGEEAEVTSDQVGLNGRLPLSARVTADALELRRDLFGALDPVAQVLGARAGAQVDAPVIQAVVVDVVHDDSRVSDTEEHPVHLESRSSSVDVPVALRVEGVASRVPVSEPLGLADRREVSLVDHGDLATVQWYCEFTHRVSSGGSVPGACSSAAGHSYYCTIGASAQQQPQAAA